MMTFLLLFHGTLCACASDKTDGTAPDITVKSPDHRAFARRVTHVVVKMAPHVARLEHYGPRHAPPLLN